MLLIFFFKKFPGIPSECQTVWTLIKPDLGPKCLQRLSAEDTSRQRVNSGVFGLQESQCWSVPCFAETCDRKDIF